MSVTITDNVIYKSALGDVKLGKLRNQDVICKSLLNFVSESQSINVESTIMREISSLSMFRHQNLVQYLGVIHDGVLRISHSKLDASSYLVYESIPSFSLYDLFTNSLHSPSSFKTNYISPNRMKMSIEDIIDVMIDVSNALLYMHSFEIQNDTNTSVTSLTHGNLTSRNIFICGNKVKLFDYYDTRLLISIKSTVETSDSGSVFPFSIAYTAPELIRSKDRSSQMMPSVDIYSLGVILLELCCNEYPKVEKRQDQMNEANNIFPVFSSIMQSMLSINPLERPSVDIVHQYFYNLKIQDKYYSSLRFHNNLGILAYHQMELETNTKTAELKLQLSQCQQILNNQETKFKGEIMKNQTFSHDIHNYQQNLENIYSAVKQVDSKFQSFLSTFNVFPSVDFEDENDVATILAYLTRLSDVIAKIEPEYKLVNLQDQDLFVQNLIQNETKLKNEIQYLQEHIVAKIQVDEFIKFKVTDVMNIVNDTDTESELESKRDEIRNLIFEVNDKIIESRSIDHHESDTETHSVDGNNSESKSIMNKIKEFMIQQDQKLENIVNDCNARLKMKDEMILQLQDTIDSYRYSVANLTSQQDNSQNDYESRLEQVLMRWKASATSQNKLQERFNKLELTYRDLLNISKDLKTQVALQSDEILQYKSKLFDLQYSNRSYNDDYTQTDFDFDDKNAIIENLLIEKENETKLISQKDELIDSLNASLSKLEMEHQTLSNEISSLKLNEIQIQEKFNQSTASIESYSEKFKNIENHVKILLSHLNNSSMTYSTIIANEGSSQVISGMNSNDRDQKSDDEMKIENITESSKTSSLYHLIVELAKELITDMPNVIQGEEEEMLSEDRIMSTVDETIDKTNKNGRKKSYVFELRELIRKIDQNEVSSENKSVQEQNIMDIGHNEQSQEQKVDNTKHINILHYSNEEAKFKLERVLKREGHQGLLTLWKAFPNEDHLVWRIARATREQILGSNDAKTYVLSNGIIETSLQSLMFYTNFKSNSATEMREKAVVVTQSQIIRLLGALTYKNDISRRKYGELGIMSVLCDIIQQSKDAQDSQQSSGLENDRIQLLTYVFTLLTNLCHNSYENRCRFMEADGTYTLSSTMEVYLQVSTVVLRQILCFLVTLAGNDDISHHLLGIKSSDNQKTLRKHEQTDGVSNVLIKSILTYSMDKEIQLYGFWAICNLSMAGEKICRKFRKFEILDICYLALDNHQGNKEVVTQVNQCISIINKFIPVK